MLDQVFANLASGFSDTFGAPFKGATAKWPGTRTLDGGGSIVTPAVPQTLACKAQVSAPTQAMRQAEGFVETDVRLLILAAGLARAIDTTARVTVGGTTYRLLSVVRDSAGIGYSCAARQAKES